MNKNQNNNLGSENMLFDLLNGFMSICQPGFQNQEVVMQQWGKFKELITNRPIDYHQEIDTNQPQPAQLSQQQGEGFDFQFSSTTNKQNTETYSSTNAKLFHSQKHGGLQNNIINSKENGFSQNQQQNNMQNNGQLINSNNINQNNNHNQTQNNAQQGRTNNFNKNNQLLHSSNNSINNQTQQQNIHMNYNNSAQQLHTQPSIASSVNNNYFISTVGNPQSNHTIHNQFSNSSSFNNELFAGSNINMFKTTGNNIQQNSFQNQKKGENRSSTRDQFNQSSQNNGNYNNYNVGSSMNMYNSNGTSNQGSQRNNHRSSFNANTVSNQYNNGFQQSTGTPQLNQKNFNNSQAAINNGQNMNFSSSGSVQAMANMHNSKENYNSFNNISNSVEKSSPMNPYKFTNSFKGGNIHSIYNNNQNTSQCIDTNHQFNTQQSPEKRSSQKHTSFKHPNNQNYNNVNTIQNNNGNQIINNNNGLPSETSTFVKDENLYQIKSFSDFLKEHTRISSFGKNTQFVQTSVLELQNNSNSLLKLASIAFFVNLISELPHPESNSNQTCRSSQNQLIDIFLKVYNKKLKIHVSSNQIFTSEQLINSFTKNIGLLIQLYLLHGQNTTKLVKAFLYQVQHDPLYLDSLVILIKELTSEFVEECEYEAIASILMSQQQQLQQNSLSSTCASISQISESKTPVNLTEKERRSKLSQKLRQPCWKEVKPEWLFLLSLALQRPIELFNLRDNKLEQTLFKSKKMQINDIVSNNKINIVTVTHSESKFPVYYLMTMKQSETDLYASLSINFKKNDLKLNEEVNFPYLIKQINREKEQYSQKQQPQQQQLNSPSHTQQAQQAQQQLSPQQLQQQLSQQQLQLQQTQQQQLQLQQQNQQTFTQSNSNSNLTKEYSMGHRSSKLGLHLNQIQQQQSPNSHQLQQSINGSIQNHQQNHNSSVEDQGRKSHSIKTNPFKDINIIGQTSIQNTNAQNNNATGQINNLNNSINQNNNIQNQINSQLNNINSPSQLTTNPQAQSPRMQSMKNQNTFHSAQNQQHNNQQLQQPQQFNSQLNQQQKNAQIAQQNSQQNPLFSKIANKFSHFENISPKFHLDNLNFQSTVNNRQNQFGSSFSQDDWNKNLLYAKMKDLIFTLNINSEQLNSLARFSINSSQNGAQSKENNQPKSPLKYKSILYPIIQQK